MGPFPDNNYRQVVPAVARRCPLGWCAVCCSQPLLVRKDFADVIRGSWSPAELVALSRAARSAML